MAPAPKQGGLRAAQLRLAPVVVGGGDGLKLDSYDLAGSDQTLGSVGVVRAAGLEDVQIWLDVVNGVASDCMCQGASASGVGVIKVPTGI
jgi:hypothetical protein